MEIETSSNSSEMAQDSLPWVEKYRPTELLELISQNHITTTCKTRLFFIFFN